VVDGSRTLTVLGLTKVYHGTAAVSDVSFEVGRGDIVGLLGPNGSGKSTTLHSIVGIVRPSAGDILIGGYGHTEPLAKDEFGFVPDDLPFPGSLTAREVTALYRRLRPRYDSALADMLLTVLGLGAHLTKPIGAFSHGMKRKLQLVTALAHRPRLLIMDEPMRGLDPEAAVLLRTVVDMFVRQGGAVLLATHDLAAAEHLCHRVVVISGGTVVAAGAPAQLLSAHGVTGLEELFIRVTGLDQRIAGHRSALSEVRFHELPDQPVDALTE